MEIIQEYSQLSEYDSLAFKGGNERFIHQIITKDTLK